MRFILRIWLRPSTYVDEEEVPFVLSVFTSIKQRVCLNLHALQERILRWIKPLTTCLVLETFADLTRGKAELLAEYALLRHQLIICVDRSNDLYIRKKIECSSNFSREWFGTGNKRSLSYSQRRISRWHRELFQLFWKPTSKTCSEVYEADSRHFETMDRVGRMFST